MGGGGFCFALFVSRGSFFGLFFTIYLFPLLKYDTYDFFNIFFCWKMLFCINAMYQYSVDTSTTDNLKPVIKAVI